MSTPKPRGKVRTQLWATSHLLRSRMLTLMSPSKYVGMTRILRAYGPHATTGFALAANRRPDGIGLIDELGQLTWREIQERADALAVGLIAANGVKPTSVAILCRNHRGFVDALLAAGRLGVPALLLNTGFTGPAIAEVLEREGAGLVIYDEEFSEVIADSRSRILGLVEVLSWVDDLSKARPGPTTEELIRANAGRKAEVVKPG